MISSTLSGGRGTLRIRLGGLLTALAFGFTGFLFGMHQLAVVMLKHVVTSDASLSFQEITDFLPVPRKLDWNVPFIQTLVSLREMRGPFLMLVGVLMLAALGALFLFILQYGGNEMLLPLASQPRLVPAADDQAASDAGSAFSDDTTQPAPRRLRLGMPALLYIVAAAILITFGVPPVSETLLRYYHTLGTFHQGYWQRIAVPSLVSCVSIWCAVGLILYAFCAVRRRLARRMAAIACALGAFGLAFWCQQSLRIQAISQRYDWTPAILTTAPPYRPDRGLNGVPDGVDAAQLLAARLKLKFGNQPEQPERPLVIFVPIPAGAFNVVQEGFTEDGLTASVDSVKPVAAFLEQRRFETALSWVAIKHLFNVATVHFDTTAAVDACMTDMERCPHLSQCGPTTRTMLFTCAASAANLALVDRWADEGRYAHPTRESKRLMGQLYERFGQTEKALVWYRRADMPQSFLARVTSEKPLFHSGRISGRLLLNGKPLAGVQVGVAPRRLNGLPPDLEPSVLRTRFELAAFRPYGVFPRNHPRPYALRWISASTVSGSSGQFDISDLTEGEYMLVCTLPPSAHLNEPMNPALSVASPLSPLTVNYKHPTRDLGPILLKIAQ